MAVLQADNITKGYEGQEIIRDVSLSLGEGEVVSLLGVSGVGKTTLFNVLSGLEKPDGGTVTVDGTDVTGRPGAVSYMLQRDLLLPHKTVLDNAALPLVLRGVSRGEARARAAEQFPLFGLEGAEKKYPAQLSGGQRQRAALLRTFLGSGGVILLDEPFSALDAMTKGELHRWYRERMALRPVTTLLITHDVDEALVLSHRVCVLSGRPGRITAQLTVERPAGDTDFSLTPAFLEYKKELLRLLASS